MICKHCNNPIIMHLEGRYTIEDSDDMEYGMHYSCHEARLKEFDHSKKLPEVEATLARLKTLFLVAGWLLVTSPGSGGNVIAWYETEADCAKASEYWAYSKCGPDRFEFSEGGSLYQKK